MSSFPSHPYTRATTWARMCSHLLLSNQEKVVLLLFSTTRDLNPSHLRQTRALLCQSPPLSSSCGLASISFPSIQKLLQKSPMLYARKQSISLNFKWHLTSVLTAKLLHAVSPQHYLHSLLSCCTLPPTAHPPCHSVDSAENPRTPGCHAQGDLSCPDFAWPPPSASDTGHSLPGCPSPRCCDSVSPSFPKARDASHWWQKGSFRWCRAAGRAMWI